VAFITALRAIMALPSRAALAAPRLHITSWMRL
jgi:hypothetical protein